MKTYTKTTITQSPLLVIEYDSCPESPRHDSNVGYFLTKQGKYKSPDGNDCDLYHTMLETGDVATSTTHHMEMIQKEHEDIVYITPVYRYEHGNIVYRRGTAHGFDVSNCGFYIVTTDSLKETHGTDTPTTEQIEQLIDQELDTYTCYVNGDVYRFTLYDEQGEITDSCGGFYCMDDIKQFLSDEWKDEDMEDYFIYT